MFILSLSPEHNVYLFHRGSTLCLHIFFCYVIPVEPWTDLSILSLSYGLSFLKLIHMGTVNLIFIILSMNSNFIWIIEFQGDLGNPELLVVVEWSLV